VSAVEIAVLSVFLTENTFGDLGVKMDYKLNEKSFRFFSFSFEHP